MEWIHSLKKQLFLYIILRQIYKDITTVTQYFLKPALFSEDTLEKSTRNLFTSLLFLTSIKVKRILIILLSSELKYKSESVIKVMAASSEVCLELKSFLQFISDHLSDGQGGACSRWWGIAYVQNPAGQLSLPTVKHKIIHQVSFSIQSLCTHTRRPPAQTNTLKHLQAGQLWW